MEIITLIESTRCQDCGRQIRAGEQVRAYGSKVYCLEHERHPSSKGAGRSPAPGSPVRQAGDGYPDRPPAAAPSRPPVFITDRQLDAYLGELQAALIRIRQQMAKPAVDLEDET